MNWGMGALAGSVLAFLLSAIDPVVGKDLRTRASRASVWVGLGCLGTLRALVGPSSGDPVLRGATLVICFAVVVTGFRPGLILPRVNSSLSSTPRSLRVRGVVATWLTFLFILAYSIYIQMQIGGKL